MAGVNCSSGYKASGIGREYGIVGVSEYLEPKSVTRKC
jgi:acyl-CoA reductase-like NAD-dependent aldehyde dehydrogenase